MLLTGLQLSKKILEETKIPMNPEEMWAYAVDKGYDKKTSVKGKTPWSTLGAQIYTNIQKHEDSIFVKVSTHPQKFGLREYEYDQTEPKASVAQKAASKVMERDLHPLLVSFVNSDVHFHAQTMTIYQEHSTKAGKNAEQWMHPDLVSVNMPFDDLNPGVITLANNAGINTVAMFSFELKKEITGANVRQYYFQAVSNSSWANEGYLVAPVITEDALEQLSRLNGSFGIGVIRLNLEDVHQSEVLLPSRENDLDIAMINDLCSINRDFSKFVKFINDSLKLGYIVPGTCDDVMDDDQLREYMEKKKITTKNL